MARHGSESVGVAAGAEVAAAGPDQATSADAPGPTGFADYLHSHRYQRLSGQMRWWELALELGVAGACSAGAAAAVADLLSGEVTGGKLVLDLGAFLLSGALGLFALSLPVFHLKRKRVDDRLRREGVRARGTIIGIYAADNSQISWLVRYRYMAGDRFFYSTAYDLIDVVRQLTPGQSGDVFYDPARPGLSTWRLETSRR